MRSTIPLLLLLLLVSSPALALVQNGAFDDGLAGWQTSGDVTLSGGAARLADAGADVSALYQGVATGAGSFVLHFDVEPSLSTAVPQLGFPDVFFASLYLADDLSGFDPALGNANAALPLFDLDHAGVSNLTGELDPLDGGVLHYSLPFETSFAFAIPTFELFELGQAPGDSWVQIDNVRIVPEPGTTLLLGAGLALLAVRGRVSP
jgi:hypothetical protein